jgi:hypothetical protein
MMNRMFLTLTLTPILNGCATMLVRASGCDFYGEGDCELPSPDALATAAIVDRRAVEALGWMGGDTGYAPLEPVVVEGTVSSCGAPLSQARVQLLMGDELWGRSGPTRVADIRCGTCWSRGTADFSAKRNANP